jgi:hypothetical protein
MNRDAFCMEFDEVIKNPCPKPRPVEPDVWREYIVNNIHRLSNDALEYIVDTGAGKSHGWTPDVVDAAARVLMEQIIGFDVV